MNVVAQPNSAARSSYDIILRANELFYMCKKAFSLIPVLGGNRSMESLRAPGERRTAIIREAPGAQFFFAWNSNDNIYFERVFFSCYAFIIEHAFISSENNKQRLMIGAGHMADKSTEMGWGTRMCATHS